ncbi:MAG: HicB family protein [Desulfobacteraceae bacterium 4572_19]|nr:MAG: HicB family protein [Desulfobacteraceae bacterium 4572_19]
MLIDYINTAMCCAKYEILSDDGSYYGEIPECNGVYANSDNLEDCRNELQKVLEDWILFRIHKNLFLPCISGLENTLISKRIALLS